MPFEQIQWVDLDRELAKEAIRKDFQGFCEWNRMDRMAADKAFDLQEYRKLKTTGDRDAAAQKMNLGGDPWITSLMGHPHLKKMGTTHFSVLCEYYPRALECAGEFSKALEKTYPVTNYNVRNYDSEKYIQRPVSDGDKTKLQLACTMFSPKSFLSCRSASSDLVDILTIRAGVTGVPLIVDTMKDPTITKALQRVSLKLWQRIEKQTFEKNADIYSELTAELMKDGFKEKEARKKAVLILGAIATGGPNFVKRINSSSVAEFPKSCQSKPGCNLNGIYMQAIAEGMVHGDTFKMQLKEPSLYSLPPGTDFSCDIGKSYHFWLSAALTDRLMDLGHSADTARAVVYASEVGYQLGGANSERGNSALAKPRYGSIENGIRMDLNLAAAGTYFGASVENPPNSLPLKNGLLKMMDAGNSTPYETGKKFEVSVGNVTEWMDRVGAKAAFALYP